MRAVWMTGLLVLVALAGCADDGTSATDSDEFNDRDVKVSQDTGVILGVVVDQSITPVAGATVVLTSTDPVREELTDDQGRFVFDELEPGSHFLKVTKELYEAVQTSTEVVAGVDKPDTIKVQLPKLFAGEPYVQSVPKDGFFTCSQANTPPYFYSSSSCHDTYWVDLSDYGVTLDQERTFHIDIGPGWQDAIFEMTWEASAQGTSERMGMVVSTEKESRDGSHWFANIGSENPMRFELQPGVNHESSGSVDPKAIPPEGWTDVSYFMSVRPPSDAVCVLWCVPPGLAFDQRFSTFVNVFYYANAPEGWSIVAGDQPPF